MGMSGDDRGEAPISAEQRVYAQWLDWGTKAGLALLTATFALYVLRIVDPHIPLENLPQFWTLPVDRYLAATGLPSGWGWIAHIHRGDMLNFVGVAILASITVICFVRLAYGYLRAGDRLFAALAIAEICVLALAAIGVAGH